MPSPPSRLEATYRLLLALCSASQLRTLGAQLDPSIAGALHQLDTASKVAHLVATKAVADGSEDALLDALNTLYPRRRQEIASTRELFTPQSTQPTAPSLPLRVLFACASPEQAPEIALGREYEVAKRVVRSSPRRAEIELLHPVLEATVSDLVINLVEHEPTMLHLSCHGDRDQSLLLNGPEIAGGVQAIAAADLLRLLTSLPTRPRVILLSACHSAPLVDQLARHTELCVGFDGPVDDDYATSASELIYSLLGRGVDLRSLARLLRASLSAEFGESAQNIHCRVGAP